MNAAKEKLEIVSGAAPPPFRIFAGGFLSRNAFGLIQEYCTLRQAQCRPLLQIVQKIEHGQAQNDETQKSREKFKGVFEHFSILSAGAVITGQIRQARRSDALKIEKSDEHVHDSPDSHHNKEPDESVDDESPTFFAFFFVSS